MPGKVYLVGAGPGDPGLITVRGAGCLKQADLVLYDYLVNPQLLEHAPAAAEKVCLGRHGQGKLVSQDEINQQMISAAGNGKTVVRLKSGDPAVFGRLAEETRALAEAGIEFEIVSGITAAFAAAGCAGVSLTDRQRASAVALITGREGDAKSEAALDYRGIAGFPGTLVFYMGVTTAKTWTQGLIDSGKPPATPCVIVRRCSWPNQRALHCRLDEVAGWLDQARPDRLRPPVIVIVGDVSVIDETLAWFSRRPLFGQTVLVSRALDQAVPLRDRLQELGAEVLVQPAIEIADPPDWTPLDRALGQLAQYDWLVFSSSNGVRYFFQRLWQQGDMRQLGRIKLAAIGPGTADELARWKLKADLVPPEFRAESLVESLRAADAGSPSQRYLLIRASRGRDVLAEGLSDGGAQVEQLIAYSSLDVAAPDPDILTAVSTGRVDWVTVTSSAIARSLVRLFGERLRGTKLVSISPVTSATLRELGYPPAIEALTYTMDGVVDAVLKAKP